MSPTDEMYSDALGDVVYCDNTWGWLEANAKAGGDLTRLHVRPDFKASSKVYISWLLIKLRALLVHPIQNIRHGKSLQPTSKGIVTSQF